MEKKIDIQSESLPELCTADHGDESHHRSFKF